MSEKPQLPLRVVALLLEYSAKQKAAAAQATPPAQPDAPDQAGPTTQGRPQAERGRK